LTKGWGCTEKRQVKLNNASVNADQFDHQLISENINAEKDSAGMKITRTCNGNEATEELPTVHRFPSTLIGRLCQNFTR
jgi:hypothetical protein